MIELSLALGIWLVGVFSGLLIKLAWVGDWRQPDPTEHGGEPL